MHDSDGPISPAIYHHLVRRCCACYTCRTGVCVVSRKWFRSFRAASIWQGPRVRQLKPLSRLSPVVPLTVSGLRLVFFRESWSPLKTLRGDLGVKVQCAHGPLNRSRQDPGRPDPQSLHTMSAPSTRGIATPAAGLVLPTREVHSF